MKLYMSVGKRLHLLHADHAPLEEVVETSGRADHDLHARRDVPQLVDGVFTSTKHLHRRSHNPPSTIYIYYIYAHSYRSTVTYIRC